MDISDTPSPNFDERRHPLDMLVLHYTGMETGQMALDRMCDPEAKVSAHYLIREGGRIERLVPEALRAWHAGVSSWQGDEDLNSRSVGIEIVNRGHDWPLPDGAIEPYPDVQIEAVIALASSIIKRHRIPPSRIVGHSDIAPARKQDPGEHFPWERLARAGIGVWPGPVAAANAPPLLLGDTGDPVRVLQTHLAGIGFGLDATSTFDDATLLTVRAFQRRWRQSRVTGTADAETVALIAAVFKAFQAGGSARA